LATAAGLLAGGSGLYAQAQADTAVEDKAPALPALGSLLPLPDMQLLDGRSFGAASAQGRVLVLYWWASWCPFCAQQSPAMQALWRAQESRGLLMLGLSIDRKAEDASRYLAQHGYTFPAALLTPAVARMLPKPRGLPVTVVRGRDGRVLAAESGQLFPEDIEQFTRFL
jgi:thiol-disulfide isomerase/thioredoxin